MADEWHWSEWITPELVPAKANLGFANAGASISMSGDDPNAALDALRTGGATGGSDVGAVPYSYVSSGEVDGDPASSVTNAQARSRSGAVFTTPPEAYADLDVGYTFGYWRERPDLRRLPPEFVAMIEADPDSYVKIKPGFDWDSFVEFEDGPTVAVEWADVYLEVSTPQADGNEVGGHVGYSDTILLPKTTGPTSFGGWPPPLGSDIAHWLGPMPPTVPLPTVKPPAGSDFTIVSYTDMAVGGYSPNYDWQEWFVRAHSGPLGQMLYVMHQMPRYRYRIPGPGLKPRFFVKHTDEVMHPVGFGKPATETTLFRAKVQGGWYRDLTTAEYDVYGPGNKPPGGYPLQVKRMTDAGETWWDHVAWLVPE